MKSNLISKVEKNEFSNLESGLIVPIHLGGDSKVIVIARD
jgi:hypothetical protein